MYCKAFKYRTRIPLEASGTMAFPIGVYLLGIWREGRGERETGNRKIWKNLTIQKWTLNTVLPFQAACLFRMAIPSLKRSLHTASPKII